MGPFVNKRYKERIGIMKPFSSHIRPDGTGSSGFADSFIHKLEKGMWKMIYHTLKVTFLDLFQNLVTHGLAAIFCFARGICSERRGVNGIVGSDPTPTKTWPIVWRDLYA